MLRVYIYSVCVCVWVAVVGCCCCFNTSHYHHTNFPGDLWANKSFQRKEAWGEERRGGGIVAFWDRGAKRAVREETWKDILEARRFESKHKSLQSQPRSGHVRNPMGFLRLSLSVHLIQLCWWKCASPYFIGWCSTAAGAPHKPSSRNITYGTCWNSMKKHVSSTCIPDVYAWLLREHPQVAFIFVLIILFKCCFYKRGQFTNICFCTRLKILKRTFYWFFKCLLH